MIRKRRRKKKLDLREKQRGQLTLLLIGATLAAILAATFPTSCNTPLTPLLNEDLQERIDELSRNAETRGKGR